MGPPVRINAKSIISDIRSNTSAPDLMKKYGLSSKGLTRIFNKLISSGLLEARELVDRYPSSPLPPWNASKDTEFTLSVPVPICDLNSLAMGILRDVSTEAIRVAGIKAEVGEIRNFQIAVENFMAAGPLEVTTQCKWVKLSGKHKKHYVAGFTFVGLTNSQRETLDRFIKVMFLSNSGEWRVAGQ